MFTWGDAFRIATLVVASVGGIGVIIGAVGKFLADRIADRYRRQTETILTEMRGRLDEGLSRLNAALQHQNFILQRLAEIELNGIHSCWRAAAHALHRLNAVRPHDAGTDRDALQRRINELSAAHNTLLSLIGKYDPFLDPNVATLLHEIARIARLEISQASHNTFEPHWWDQGDENRASAEIQIQGLRTAVQVRIVALRQVADRTRETAG